MKSHRIAIATIALAALAACASTPKAQQQASSEQAEVVAPPTAASTTEVAAAASVSPVADQLAPASAASHAAPAGDANSPGGDAVDDFAAIYGTVTTHADGTTTTSAGVRDPWEKYNRHVHAFNNKVDKYVAHPVAKAYVTVLPQAVRNRVSDFFDNLGSVPTFFNQLLQGHPSDAWNTLGRFLMNSTIGLAGLYDPASRAGIAHKHNDFGQTLAVWGWRNSRYFELPFFGPRTVRDTFGIGGDIPMSPTHYIDNDRVRYGLYALDLVDTRAQLLSTDSLRAGAPDDYALVRDAWMQHRNYQIQQDLAKKGASQQEGQEDLPDYLREMPVKTIPLR